MSQQAQKELVDALNQQMEAEMHRLELQIAASLYRPTGLSPEAWVAERRKPWQRFKWFLWRVRNRMGWAIAHFGGWVGGFDPDPAEDDYE